jgi:hypothetical protein
LKFGKIPIDWENIVLLGGHLVGRHYLGTIDRERAGGRVCINHRLYLEVGR